MEVGRRELGLRAAEDDEEQAGRVDRRQERADHGHHEQDDSERAAVERVRDDRVLREEAGEGWDAHERQRPDQERARCPWQLSTEAAHLPDVLLVREGVDHEARRHEEEGLEEGVRHQVEEAGAVRAEAGGDEHVADLAHSRVRDDALDVRLHERDEPGEKQRDPAEHRCQVEDRRRELEQDMGARDQIDAGRHHRRGVNESRDRRRALHRVGKPRVERELRGLGDGAAEESEGDQNRDRARRLDDFGRLRRRPSRSRASPSAGSAGTARERRSRRRRR